MVAHRRAGLQAAPAPKAASRGAHPAFTDAVQKAKPPGAKGHYINRVAISSTMGPGVKIEPSSLIGNAGGT
jgi:hypothetical protein